MSTPQAVIVRQSDLAAPSFVFNNSTKKFSIAPVSSDAGNLAAYGSDNGLYVGSVAAQPITIGMSTQPAFDIFYASDSVAMYEDHGLASAPVTYSLDAGLASLVDLPIKPVVAN